MSKVFDNKSAKKIIKSTRKLPKYARKISKQHKQKIINNLFSNDANEIPVDIKADHVINNKLNNKSNDINLYNLDDKENITYECENDSIVDKKVDIDEFDKCLDCICADIENIDYPDIN